jgi:hypothetical protein
VLTETVCKKDTIGETKTVVPTGRAYKDNKVIGPFSKNFADVHKKMRVIFCTFYGGKRGHDFAISPCKISTMADLNVQPKKRTPVWPWILLALIIAAVIFFVARNNNSSTSDSDDTTTTDTTNTYRTDTTRP